MYVCCCMSVCLFVRARWWAKMYPYIVPVYTYIHSSGLYIHSPGLYMHSSGL